jgi:eukaryotic-like serine/threonine-protein kinase
MTRMGPVRGAEEPAEGSAALVGRVLSERYRIERHLRSSNMSHVYEGRDLVQQQRVAVKVLHEEIQNERTLCRFFLEARVGRLLSENAHTVTVTDVGFTGRAVPYFVMEYLVGEDLAAHLRKHRRVTPERAVVILLELCAAVAALHQAGVVHRDIKPSNVFLRDTGHVCLIDFGVCKLTDSDISLTHTGELVGSMHYVPPERWIDPDDARLCGDVWGLAVILYELLNGCLPFKGQSRDSLKQAILTQELRLGFDGEARLPELHTVLLVALHKDPRYRYSTVPDFAAALGRAAFDAGLRDEPSFLNLANPSPDVQVDGPPSGEDSAVAPELPTSPAASSAGPVSQRRSLAWAIAALGAFGVAVALGATSLRGAATPSPPAVRSSAAIAPSASNVRGSVEAPARPSPTAPPPQPRPRPSPPAKAGIAAGRVGPTAPALSTAPRAESPLPRPADPPFARAGGEPPGPAAPAPTLDLTPADLRHF